MLFSILAFKKLFQCYQFVQWTYCADGCATFVNTVRLVFLLVSDYFYSQFSPQSSIPRSEPQQLPIPSLSPSSPLLSPHHPPLHFNAQLYRSSLSTGDHSSAILAKVSSIVKFVILKIVFDTVILKIVFQASNTMIVIPIILDNHII